MAVLYDGDCGFCKVMLAALLKWDRAHRLTAVPIQGPEGERLLPGMSPEDRLRSWHLVDDAGTIHSAGAAIPVVLAALPRGTPLARLTARFPGPTSRTYEWVATHRTLLGRALPKRTRTWSTRVIASRYTSQYTTIRRVHDGRQTEQTG